MIVNWRGAAAAGALAASLFTTNALATEGGGNQYFNSASNIMAGVGLGPGDYFMSYTGYYHSDRLNDADGNRRPIAFDVTTVSESLRYIHRTSIEVLGAQWGYYVVVPIAHVDARVGTLHQTKTGVGDVLLVPAVLAWHTPNLHWVAAVDFTVPTGSYSKNDIANTGRNVFGIMPNVGVTYLSDSGFETSARIMYNFNTNNNATGYQSGQEFMVDYFIGGHFGNWVAGLAGYSYLQTTDDAQRGRTVANARGLAQALGPAVSYNFGSFQLFGSYTHEVAAENRPMADRGLIRAVISF